MKLIDILVEELPKRGGWPDDSDEMSQSQFDCEIYTESKFLPDFYVGERVEDNGIDNGVTREQYEAALAAKNEGWIEWCGGRCPVDDVTEVDIKFRAGGIVYDVEAGKYYWPRTGQEYDIIAYRLHNPQEAEQANADEEADLNECIGQDAAPVWNGEGLPPVGVECEYSWAGEPWASGVIRYISKHTIIIETQADSTGDTECAYHPTDIKLRPFRTEADRKRDEAVKTIMLTGWCQAAAEEIYDLVAAGKVPGMKLED